MLSLLEIQAGFASALRNRSYELPEDLILADGMSAQTRLDVYRNNVFASLQDLLKERFPAVCRVVHERFFLYAADEFIREDFPQAPVLSGYGRHFPDFLGRFPGCRSLAYLPDLARLEWLIFHVATTSVRPPIQADALSTFAPEDWGGLMFELDPSLGLLESMWPVDLLWRANHQAAQDEVIHLRPDRVLLEVRRVAGQVGFRRLPEGVFAFRSALLGAKTLQEAAAAALLADSSFDLAGTLSDMVREAVLVDVGFALGETKDERWKP